MHNDPLHEYLKDSEERQFMESLYLRLADDNPEVVVTMLRAIRQGTDNNFTGADLNRVHTLCGQHRSVKVREAYGDFFYAQYVGDDPAPGALETLCNLTRDDDKNIRCLACARLVNCFVDIAGFQDRGGKISAALNAVRSDASANVRFIALAGLARLGESHTAQIEQELIGLADHLEQSDSSAVTCDVDNGLGHVLDIVSTPSRHYVLGIERVVISIKAALVDEELELDGYLDALDSMLAKCRQA